MTVGRSALRFGISTSTHPIPEPLDWPMRSHDFLLHVATRITPVGESSVRLSSIPQPMRHGRSARDVRCQWSPRI
jgi:hypothetical protein